MSIRLTGLLCFALSILCPFALGGAHKQSKVQHWGYVGEEGPTHWGNIDPKYAACGSGLAQSPIDIESVTKSDLPELQFDYKPAPLDIVDNGHTIMVNYAPGSTLHVGDKVYQLKQFHFHHPSEERIHGRPTEMVVHLVHQDADGNIAVVAVLLKKSHANQMVDVLWNHLPKTKEQPLSLADVTINAKDLLPSSFGYYTLTGSLTTPPCTEGVRWFVMKNPQEVSPKQVHIFAKHYKKNARPVQSLNGRTVLASNN